jgi:CO/xanthine dehydrogenase FAD-binding subunit
MLREIRVPVRREQSISKFFEVSVRQEGVAVVGLAAHIVHQAGAIRRVALVAMGVDAIPVRLRAAEALLVRDGLVRKGAIDNAAALATEELRPSSDAYASAAYRKQVGGALVRKALEAAAVEMR